MNRRPSDEHELEVALRGWLRSERVEAAPSVLRGRLAGIPRDSARRPWIHLRIVAVAATVVLALVTTIAGVSLLRPALPGAPADACDDSRALLQRAVAELNALDGYRWGEHHQEWTWDPEHEPSFENPRYAWAGSRAQGAYLAPDAVHWLVVMYEEGPAPARHVYAELFQVGDEAWGKPRTQHPETPPRWIELGGTVPAPGHELAMLVDWLEIRPVELTRSVPGSGGCVVSGHLPRPDPIGDEGFGDERLYRFAARIGDDGRLLATLTELVHEDGLSSVAEGVVAPSRTAVVFIYEVPHPIEWEAPPEGPPISRPAGSEAAPCDEPERQLRRAVQHLRNVEAYAWHEHVQLWHFDPEHPLSADDPRYAWVGYGAEGAYLAPDRMQVTVVDSEAAHVRVGVLGSFLEARRIGDRAWGRAPQDASPPGWQELPYEVEANRVLASWASSTWRAVRFAWSRSS